MTEQRECAACGDPCTNGLRWCSNACFYAEDGYPYEDADYNDAEREDD